MLCKLFTQYFPGASKNGLFCSTTLGSLSVVGSGLTFSRRDLDTKRRVCVVAGLIISAILTHSLAEKLLGRVDLNFKGSFRFALAEAIIFGITEATLPFCPVTPLIDGEYTLSQESIAVLSYMEQNPGIRGGAYIGKEFIAACESLGTGSALLNKYT